MFSRRPIMAILALLVLGAFLIGLNSGPSHPAQAISLGGSMGDLVKIFGVAWVVKHFSGDINDFINKGLKQHDAAIEGHTKVVPIIRVGSGGTAVGAAQVMGPRQQVETVQAVAEVQMHIAGSVRARALIPVSSENVSTIKSVGGVGVSANIKFPL